MSDPAEPIKIRQGLGQRDLHDFEAWLGDYAAREGGNARQELVVARGVVDERHNRFAFRWVGQERLRTA